MKTNTASSPSRIHLIQQSSRLAVAGAITLGLAACGGGGDSGGGAAADGGAADTATPPTLEGGVAFSPEFPVAMFVGTPVKGKLPNLEKAGTPPTKEIQVPEGTIIISKGKTITSSDEFPVIGDIEYVTDGEKEGGDGYYVELGPDLQWVQIDLEADHNIEGLCVWHFHKNARAYKDVIVQISDDPEFKSNVTTVYNNDHDNSAGKGVGKDPAYIETNHGRLIRVPGVKGRYVRLLSNGSTTDDLNHYVEVEIYGNPASS